MLRHSLTSADSGRKQRAILLGVLTLTTCAAFAGTFVVKSRQHTAAAQQADVLGQLPTLARPLPSYAKQTTLANAPAALGATVNLPNSPGLAASDAGAVWTASATDPSSGSVVTTAAVTFPAQGVVMEYTHPAPSDGSAAHFQAMADGMTSPSGAPIAQVITLTGGVPALAVQQNSDATGVNFGEVIFNSGNTEIRVMGHSPEAVLQGIAQAVLAQSG